MRMRTDGTRSHGRRIGTRAAVLVVALLAGACGIPRWPVEGAISSPFGLRRTGFWPDIHHGVDIPLPVGTPVRAMMDGTVAYAGQMRGYGNVVMIDHGRRTLSVYAHLSALEVKTGDKVKGQQVIGRSGASGNATGPHLHFEIRRDGWPEDPVNMLGGFPKPRR